MLRRSCSIFNPVKFEQTLTPHHLLLRWESVIDRTAVTIILWLQVLITHHVLILSLCLSVWRHACAKKKLRSNTLLVCLQSERRKALPNLLSSYVTWNKISEAITDNNIDH